MQSAASNGGLGESDSNQSLFGDISLLCPHSYLISHLNTLTPTPTHTPFLSLHLRPGVSGMPAAGEPRPAEAVTELAPDIQVGPIVTAK